MKLMKRLSMFALIGILGLSTFSCLNNDDADFVNYGYFTTEGVTVNPDSIMPMNQTTNVRVNYSKTNSCQKFIQFSLLGGKQDDSIQYIGVLGSQGSGQSCLPSTSIESKILKFTPKKAGKYTLKFWTGKNSENKDTYNDSIVLDIKEK
ncbi:hypothetical protein [Empedobacter falsenii]|uniref:hypothetical protein n=1 Tax=Empedobacter falsenii TaxID=343874 RepID=UPI001C8D39E7|nr:hypothetical protein [Empedobacter falsenii]MBY0067382.1 hypothetical protein [Empedobacter falsenii]